MSAEENKNLARKWVETFGKTDPSGFDALVATNFVDRMAPPGMPPNLEGVKMIQHGYHTAFPDIKFTVGEVVADDKTVAVTWSAAGTHTGPLMNYPATGKAIKVFGANVFHVANGKITEHWVFFDQLSLMQQLGFAPMPGG